MLCKKRIILMLWGRCECYFLGSVGVLGIGVKFLVILSWMTLSTHETVRTTVTRQLLISLSRVNILVLLIRVM